MRKPPSSHMRKDAENNWERKTTKATLKSVSSGQTSSSSLRPPLWGIFALNSTSHPRPSRFQARCMARSQVCKTECNKFSRSASKTLPLQRVYCCWRERQYLKSWRNWSMRSLMSLARCRWESPWSKSLSKRCNQSWSWNKINSWTDCSWIKRSKKSR